MKALFKFADGDIITLDNYEIHERDIEGNQDIVDSLKRRKDRNDNMSFNDRVNGIDIVKNGKDLVAVEFIF